MNKNEKKIEWTETTPTRKEKEKEKKRKKKQYLKEMAMFIWIQNGEMNPWVYQRIELIEKMASKDM